METDRFGFLAFVLIGLMLLPAVSPSLDRSRQIRAGRIAISSMSLPRGTVDPDIIMDVNDPKMTWNGTTLFADLQKRERPRIVEVNMVSEIVWQYVLPENLKEFTNPGLDVELLPNNNVLFLLPRKGVYEINRKGDIIWSYLDAKVSHDADRLPNGNTLVVWGGGDEVGDAQVKEVTQKGETVWSWYARDHFYKVPFKDVYDEGWTHTNSATRLPNGDTLISLRNFNLIVEVNLQGSVVWSWGNGVENNQHSPKILPNGNLLVCDSGNERVVEVNRKTGEIVWRFKPERRAHIRDADRLPNGNTLIVMGDRIIEVTSDLKVVWAMRFTSPVQVPQRERRSYDYYKAERVGMVAPQLSILSPQDGTYSSNEISISIKYSDVDLSAIWYRMYDRDKGKWATGDLMYIRNRWSDAMTFDRKEAGISKITLGDGNYALHVWANSTGWGDLGENIFEPKFVSVAEASVNFSVSTKQASVTTVTSTRTPEIGPAPTNAVTTYGLAGLVTAAVVAAVFLRRRKTSRRRDRGAL